MSWIKCRICKYIREVLSPDCAAHFDDCVRGKECLLAILAELRQLHRFTTCMSIPSNLRHHCCHITLADQRHSGYTPFYYYFHSNGQLGLCPEVHYLRRCGGGKELIAYTADRPKVSRESRSYS